MELVLRFAVLVGLVSCVEIPPEGEQTSSIIVGCPKWGCNENSPVMGPYVFHELNLHGTNLEGITVDKFHKGGNTYQPWMYNGSELRATNVADPNDVLSGTALETGYFKLDTALGTYKLSITHVSPRAASPVKHWVGPATPVETYELTYSGPRITFEKLCRNPPGRDSGEGGTHVWEAPLEAILYTGDRYEALHKVVTQIGYGATSGWMNIACAGSALAKMHLVRHTTAGSYGTFQSTLLSRQAMLKMYVSDICGNGFPFTKPGTPLHWRNNPNWMQLAGDEFAIESLWTSSGALCMNIHRRGDEFAADIAAMCAPQPCPVVSPNTALPLGAYVVSAVPTDPNAN